MVRFMFAYEKFDSPLNLAGCLAYDLGWLDGMGYVESFWPGPNGEPVPTDKAIADGISAPLAEKCFTLTKAGMEKMVVFREPVLTTMFGKQPVTMIDVVAKGAIAIGGVALGWLAHHWWR